MTTAGLIPPADWNQLEGHFRELAIQPSADIGLVRNATGTSLFFRRRPGAASLHPFQVVQGADEDGDPQFYVYDGAVYNSLKPQGDIIETIGLTTKEDIEAGTEAWYVLGLNDIIWLTIIFDGTGEVTSCTVNSLEEGDVFNVDEEAWSENDGYCEHDGGTPKKHQASRILLAYSYPAEDGVTPIVLNKVFTDLLLRDCNIDGRAARYPFPTAGGYPLLPP